jgi:hypothetical protein
VKDILQFISLEDQSEKPGHATLETDLVQHMWEFKVLMEKESY